MKCLQWFAELIGTTNIYISRQRVNTFFKARKGHASLSKVRITGVVKTEWLKCANPKLASGKSSLWLKCTTPSEMPVILSLLCKTQSAMDVSSLLQRTYSRSSGRIYYWVYHGRGHPESIRVLWGSKTITQCNMCNTYKLFLHSVWKWGILKSTIWTLLFGSGKAK